MRQKQERIERGMVDVPLCPYCGMALYCIWVQSGSPRWLCRKAIGAAMFDPIARNHVMPAGDVHPHVRTYTKIDTQGLSWTKREAA